ncbi:MAG: FliI/YscN family ATPase [Phycisphaeraceae bacterium]|nr:FliI/YscN family ATPase [Phycisphaeraceae bacterium]
MTTLHPAMEIVSRIEPMRFTGRVESLRGLSVLARDLPVPVGSLVRIGGAGQARGGIGAAESLGEVVGFDGPGTIVMMLGSCAGIRPGDRVVALHAQQAIGVGSQLLGRVIDGLGRPIDGRGPVHGLSPRALDPEPLSPLLRAPVRQPLPSGVRAIDLFATLGRGQRMGVFAGPGVGKSTLLGCIARNCASDVSVIALIGERGREVRDFIEHNLGPKGLRRSVVVCATSDESPLLRARAALAASAVAEYFRDQGASVMLIMDSLTRFAHARRQIGLAVGEPPATRGYTPSVFAALARLLERAGAIDGASGGGSITGMYSILVEGDDMTEPVADAARGILDGHIMLSRALAQRAHYPAIDVLDSVSRVADDVCEPSHIAARRQLVRLLAEYAKVEDLLQIGAYAKGSNAAADVAIRYHEQIRSLLVQEPREAEPFEAARTRMMKLAVEAGAALQAAQGKRS